MKKFKMKPETKEKLKNVWIEASPFVMPLVAGVVGVLYIYSKGVETSNEHYAASLNRKDEAYEAMTDRTAASTERLNHDILTRIVPNE